MKITRLDYKNICEFSEIKICDVFEHEDITYMKIEPIESDDTNAIRLTNGCGVWFFDNETVKRLDAELVIRGFNED